MSNMRYFERQLPRVARCMPCGLVVDCGACSAYKRFYGGLCVLVAQLTWTTRPSSWRGCGAMRRVLRGQPPFNEHPPRDCPSLPIGQIVPAWFARIMCNGRVTLILMNDESLTVLIVDDDEDDFVIIEETLLGIPGSSWSIRWISEFDEASLAIKREAFDLYLFDYRLGRGTGVELLKMMRSANRLEPVIILTGLSEMGIDMQATRAGASDFLTKAEISPGRLCAVISRAIERARLQQQLSSSIARLERVARLGERARSRSDSS